LCTESASRSLKPRAVKLDRHPILRRWDHQGTQADEEALRILEGAGDGGWIALERGVEIRFCPGNLYCTGDYWWVMARVASGDLDWPQEDGGPHSFRVRALLITVRHLRRWKRMPRITPGVPRRSATA